MKSRLVFLLIFWQLSLSAQIFDPVRWQSSVENLTATEADLKFTAIIDPGWSMYAADIPDVVPRPIPTTFFFEPNPAFELVGDLEQVTRPDVRPDPWFNNANIGKFQNMAVFRQRIRILQSESFVVKATVEYMCCDDNVCLPPKEVDFEIPIDPPTPQIITEIIERVEGNPLAQISTEFEPEQEVEVTPLSYPTSPITANANASTFGGLSLWAFFLIALLTGFGGAMTPCVYPMIPLTVSFFMRDTSGGRLAGIVKALIFGLSIIMIYTLVGVIVALTKRADLINALVSHWLTNLIFAGMFITFALSFFGLFEITLGGSLADKIDKKTDKGGYISAFFMALALVIVSFSCTGPFVGGILVASTQGLAIMPILGMFGFGLAFALPFTLLAFFPSLMKKMPKSGGWMNSVKVVFAFVLLAFAVYFLSFTDRGLGWNIITRDVFLGIWIVLSALAGFYLLGKIRFAHDSEIHYINVTRLFGASASFVFAIYLFTGLLGAPLNAVAALLPTATDNRTTGFQLQIQPPDHLCGVPRFANQLSFPHGLQGYFDYDEALACAKERNKPVLLIFKGHACAKCREMEALVWTDPEILRLMNDRFILLALYTDDTTRLPENEWVTSTFDGRVKRTMGQINADFQITRFHVNAFPYHVILNPNGETIGASIGYTSSIEEFRNWLRTGLDNF